MNYTNNLTIKSWAEEDRPREKLLTRGRQALSNAELIAILLGSGSRGESAVGLAQRLLLNVENDLSELGKCSVVQLKTFKGVGAAKAITLIAALELGRRRQLTNIQERPQLSSSKDVFKAIAPILVDLPHEEFWILLLNRANRLMSREQISLGGVSGTVVDAKIVFRKAIEGKASALILCHNHPSGNLKPSKADISLTKKLKQAGEQLDILILDHLIVSEKGFYSFSDEGIL